MTQAEVLIELLKHPNGITQTQLVKAVNSCRLTKELDALRAKKLVRREKGLNTWIIYPTTLANEEAKLCDGERVGII